MKESVFQGRSLLAEKDFTKEELQYLIDFSEHLKDLKTWYPTSLSRRKNIALLFEKHLHVLVLHLLLQRSI